MKKREIDEAKDAVRHRRREEGKRKEVEEEEAGAGPLTRRLSSDSKRPLQRERASLTHQFLATIRKEGKEVKKKKKTLTMN